MKTTTLGERLALAMREERVKAVDLAKAIGVSKSALSQLLNGKTHGLKPHNLILASQKLRIRPEWLATGHGEMRAEPLTQDDRALLKTYHRLTPTKQATVDSVVRELAGDFSTS